MGTTKKIREHLIEISHLKVIQSKRLTKHEWDRWVVHDLPDLISETAREICILIFPVVFRRSVFGAVRE